MGIKKEIETILSSMICDDGTINEQFKGTKLEFCAVEQVTNWLSVLKEHCIEEEQVTLSHKKIDETAKQAEYILGRMSEKMYTTGIQITRNKLIHECRRIHSTNDFDNALARLEEKGYVRIEKVATGGRPSIKIEFNETGLGAYRIAVAVRCIYREMPLKNQIKIPFLNLMDYIDSNKPLFTKSFHFLNDCSMILDTHFEYTRDRAIAIDKSFSVFNSLITKEGALCS